MVTAAISMSTKDFEIKIDSLSYGPYGIGRREGRVIFVPLTVPGDEVEVRGVEDKGNYVLGELARLIKPSPQRQTPPCPYFGSCGGCPWQQVQYETQLAAKAKSVEDALRRIGKLDGFELLPILPPPQPYHYRRRIRLQSDHNRRLGFYRPFSHELIEIDSCLIADPQVDRCLGHARRWLTALKSKIRYLEIVSGDENGQVVLVGDAEGGLALEDDATSARFLDQHEELSGLILFGRGWRRSWGEEKILVDAEDGLKMEIDADVFLQVNQEGNRQLVREVLQWGGFHERDRVLELYCGAGNFTLPVARRSRGVVGVDGNPRSVENGRRNSRLHRVKNIRWIDDDVRKAVRHLAEAAEKFSKVILNPPRFGAKGLDEDLARLGAEKILYVSCNPATLARDLSAMSQRGYRLKRVLPIDLFPHTFHVEALAEMVPDDQT